MYTCRHVEDSSTVGGGTGDTELEGGGVHCLYRQLINHY